jgi:hypothetical protein
VEKEKANRYLLFFPPKTEPGRLPRLDPVLAPPMILAAPFPLLQEESFTWRDCSSYKWKNPRSSPRYLFDYLVSGENHDYVDFSGRASS